jgi:ribosomal protein S18 acetylase RimI-like enzyme
MTINDYEAVYALWKSIKGFAMRNVDDSRAGVETFLTRNPQTSVVYEREGRLVGSILCGHDGRRGYLYHVCVAEDCRRQGIGKEMVGFCLAALKNEGITKASLIAFTHNYAGNSFWEKLTWRRRSDLNYYEYTLNEENVTKINEG